MIGLIAKIKLIAKNATQFVSITQAAKSDQKETKNKVKNKTENLINPISNNPSFFIFIFSRLSYRLQR